MADTTQLAETTNNEKANHKKALPVKIGFNATIKVPISGTEKIVEILDIVARDRGWQLNDLIIVREGEGSEIDPQTLVDEKYPIQKRHHVHHKGDVAVTVYYNGGEWSHQYARFKTVEDVLLAAAAHFHIDESIIPQLQLATHGQKEELSATEHIGHLAGHQHSLAFDLIRGAMPNGASQ